MSPKLALLVLAVSGSSPTASRPETWPDDALLTVLEACADILRLSPFPDRSRVRDFLLLAADEAGRRRLRSAAPLLREMLFRIPTRHEADVIAGRRGAVQILMESYGRLEVASREWTRLIAEYTPDLVSICGVVGRPQLTREELLAAFVLSEMVLDSEGLPHAKKLAAHPDACVRRQLAASLGVYLAVPSPADRKLLTTLLRDPDDKTQGMALRALLRGLTSDQRQALAHDYLNSNTRLGRLGSDLARKVLAGKVGDDDLLTPEQLARRDR